MPYIAAGFGILVAYIIVRFLVNLRRELHSHYNRITINAPRDWRDLRNK